MAEVTGTSKMAARCRLSVSGPIPDSPVMKESGGKQPFSNRPNIGC